MICKTTKETLQKIFPKKAVSEQHVQTDLSDNTAEPKRQDGVIDCDYAKLGYHLDVQVSKDTLIDTVSIIDQNDFFIESITGVDWIKENELEVVYDFCRYDFELCRVVVRIRTPRDNPKVPTITDIYTGANWHERETHDFFGIDFVGHPHLIPLLLPEDADFHPLLKDFKA